jgi:leader peptidase (prepilin peptidase)/N-methyltransferase
MGDVKLAALVGFVLGWAGWSTWLLGFAAGILLGGVAAAIVLIARRSGPRGTLPYGPAMVAGALVALLL